MLLDMTVKEREAGLVGGKINGDAPIVGNDHRILQHARCFLAVDLSQLPQMPVQMRGMGVIGAIAHYETVPRALL